MASARLGKHKVTFLFGLEIRAYVDKKNMYVTYVHVLAVIIANSQTGILIFYVLSSLL